MQSLENKSEELMKLLTEDFNNIGIHSGVPFVIYTYPPEYEKELIAEVERLSKKIERRGLQAKKIRFDKLFKKFTEQSLGNLQELYSLEAEDRESLKRSIAKEIGDKMVEYIIQQSNESDTQVLLVYRTSAIHPILKVHSLMDSFENKVKIPLVLFYPGSSDKKKLRFLNKDIPEEGYYYRARIL